MALPVALQVYAENIWRRFPEEFLALGCPHLEDAFDLSFMSRQIVDTQGSRKVEIVLPRRDPQSVVKDEANITLEKYCSPQNLHNGDGDWQYARATTASKQMQKACPMIVGLSSLVADAKPSPDSTPTSRSTAASTPSRLSRLAMRRGFHIEPYAESSDPFRASAKIKAKRMSAFSSERTSRESSPTDIEMIAFPVSSLATQRKLYVQPFDKPLDVFKLPPEARAKTTFQTQEIASPGMLLCLAARTRQSKQSRV